MSSRALQIVTQLSNAPEQTMTSQELAERIGVSAHTIKNEMPQVAQILNENGARLVSRIRVTMWKFWTRKRTILFRL